MNLIAFFGFSTELLHTFLIISHFQVCGRQKDLWEYYVNEFEQNNVVLQLAKYLPINDPQLEPECYQCVLMAALHNHPVLFYNLIKVWSPDLFRVG